MSRLIDADAWIFELNNIVSDKNMPKPAREWAVGMIADINARPTAFDVEQFKTDLVANSEKMSEVKSITPYGKACSSNHRYYKAISTKKACYLLDKQLEENKNDRNSQKEAEDLDR